MCRDASVPLTILLSALASTLCPLLLSSCDGAQRTSTRAVDEAPRVDAAHARQLAISRYVQLFGDKYFTRSGEGRYIQFPVLKESDATSHIDRDGNWIVRVDPLVGLHVEARVDRDGKWVE